MAKRRNRKSTGRHKASLKVRAARWHKRMAAYPGRLLALRPSHSSVFAIGIVLGLSLGLGLGFSVAWWRGHNRAVPPTQQVAAAAPQAAPNFTPKPAPVPVPPAYVEQTEPNPDETSDVASPNPAPVEPPAVVDTTQPTSAAQPAPAPAAPVPQMAEPEVTPQPQAQPPIVSGETPLWLKNAVASIEPGNQPMIAIVLDDVGAAPSDVAGAVALPAPITLSIMTYAANAAGVAEAAHRAGHEIMVHVPMEPINRDADPGPHALLTGLASDEIARRLDWDLAQFSGYVGINNHMGSKFTQDADGMRVVLQELKDRGLLFLDSRTIATSVGDAMAAEIGVTHLARNVFLDDVIDPGDIMKELMRAEAIARKQGFAIAIGHPHPDTIAVLRQWIPEARAKGFVLVPITAIAKKQTGVTG